MTKNHAKDELLRQGPQRVFKGDQLSQIVFPLGGIGTGSVGLTGVGGLKDWEIFNRPNFGSVLPYAFPLIYAREGRSAPVCRVLRAPTPPPYTTTGMGDPHVNGEGFPHMDGCAFRGEYPFAWLDFQSRKLPVRVSLEAYNPFIPGQPDDSGFPAAILKYALTNTRKQRVLATVAWNLFNPIGSLGEAERDRRISQTEFGLGRNVNSFIDGPGLRGLLFTSEKWPAGHPRFGSMALVTDCRSITWTTHWLRAPWFAARHNLWDTFSQTGLLPSHSYGPSEDGQSEPGALGARVSLRPGESKTVTFYLTWYFPNFEKYWEGFQTACGCESGPRPTWKNYYATRFQDALDVARRLHAREKPLRAETGKFHAALFSTTAPPYLLDAVSSQMAILKTATCLRLTDGTFYGFEGSAPIHGCCPGSCTHVWNYQQALPFLFPSLERSMRTADYTHNFREDGSLGFRIRLPLGEPPDTYLACADGQMGGVLKTYRDWKISGDDAWLKRLWPSVRRALEYAWVSWDADKDGVMEGVQHNTYDIEFHGPNPMTACFYLGALVAGAEIADYLGDFEPAAEYRALYERGRAWVEEHLFNGEFFIQQYDPEKAPVHQYGGGCLSDALLGQWVTRLCGLGYILNPDQVKATLRSTFRYNWRPSLAAHANAQRVFALNDEAGLILCSWPRGGRPAVPFVYSDEVWTGIEYQVASHLLMEGMAREGLSIVKAVRDRHDGIRRNPWDEYECGHHYARAMASYGLLIALSGFSFHKGHGTLGFAPRLYADDFRTFWALDGVWGVYAQKKRRATLAVAHGAITLSRLDLARFAGAGPVTLTVGRRSIKAEADAYGSITLRKALTLKAGQELVITM